MTLLRVLLISVLGLMAAACARSVTSDVARFHQLPRPAGETIAIVPKDAAKEGSLEFAQYAGLIQGRLVGIGYQVADPGSADIVVSMDFSISEGSEKLRSRPGAFSYYNYYGPYGFHRLSHFGYGGLGYPYGGNNEVYSVTEYSRNLEMDMVDRASGKNVFEGRVESVGRDKRLPEVMPYLVDAMFTNFPGESGVTKRVSIEVPK